MGTTMPEDMNPNTNQTDAAPILPDSPHTDTENQACESEGPDILASIHYWRDETPTEQTLGTIRNQDPLQKPPSKPLSQCINQSEFRANLNRIMDGPADYWTEDTTLQTESQSNNSNHGTLNLKHTQVVHNDIKPDLDMPNFEKAQAVFEAVAAKINGYLVVFYDLFNLQFKLKLESGGSRFRIQRMGNTNDQICTLNISIPDSFIEQCSVTKKLFHPIGTPRDANYERAKWEGGKAAASVKRPTNYITETGYEVTMPLSLLYELSSFLSELSGRTFIEQPNERLLVAALRSRDSRVESAQYMENRLEYVTARNSQLRRTMREELAAMWDMLDITRGRLNGANADIIKTSGKLQLAENELCKLRAELAIAETRFRTMKTEQNMLVERNDALLDDLDDLRAKVLDNAKPKRSTPRDLSGRKERKTAKPRK